MTPHHSPLCPYRVGGPCECPAAAEAEEENTVPCELCQGTPAEDVPDHGFTRHLCEGCARREVPYCFSD